MCHVSSTLISACTCDLVSFVSATYSICMELMSNFVVVLVCFVFVFTCRKLGIAIRMFVFTLFLFFLSVLKLLFFTFLQAENWLSIRACMP